MSLKKGDFITFDLTAKIKETGEIFDTTIEEVATKAKLKNQGDKYEPRLIVLGEGWVLKAIDDALLTGKVGETSLVEIPPEKAFGNRSNDLIKTVSLQSLMEKGIRPVVNAKLQSGGKTITVRSVNSGRVVLDYNHSLAGRTLIYEITLRSVLTTSKEKVVALIHRRVPTVSADKFAVHVTSKLVSVRMPNETLNTDGIQQIKRGISQEIFKFMPDIEDVNYLEVFESPTKVAKETPKPTAPDTKIV